MKKATSIALHVQKEELKTLNLKFGNLDTDLFDPVCGFSYAQQCASYPLAPLSRAIALGREVKFRDRFTGKFRFPYLMDLANHNYGAKWPEYLDGLNDRKSPGSCSQTGSGRRGTKMGLPDETKLIDLVHQVANAKFKKLLSMVRSLQT
ncbi:hypothetical protein CCR75_008503 [Bremia lactucae]|uniref:Uncharacterized protein n=1 Tax=Bremia lactucae TaxID=4779 RepID=A0A976FM48_BRELC|nr:hypothetical protein CCR75_008503 [Bremia lactucae]